MVIGSHTPPRLTKSLHPNHRSPFRFRSRRFIQRRICCQRPLPAAVGEVRTLALKLAMNTVVAHPTSRIRIYRWAWLAVVALAALLRFTVFLGANSDSLFALGSVYGVSKWLSVVALNMIEGQKLISYLNLHHSQKWGQPTLVPGLGSGWSNGFRTLPWLYSEDDLNDPVVARMKREYKSFLKWALTIFISYIVVMPVLLGL